MNRTRKYFALLAAIALVACTEKVEHDLSGVVTALQKIMSGEQTSFRIADTVKGEWESVCIQTPYTSREYLERYAKPSARNFTEPNFRNEVLWIIGKNQYAVSVDMKDLRLMSQLPSNAVICAPFATATIVTGHEENQTNFYMAER